MAGIDPGDVVQPVIDAVTTYAPEAITAASIVGGGIIAVRVVWNLAISFMDGGSGHGGGCECSRCEDFREDCRNGWN